jgi:hypothetical protein
LHLPQLTFYITASLTLHAAGGCLTCCLLQVEASDKLLMVAAPLSSSAANSARNSLQLPVVQLPDSSTAPATAAAADQLQDQQPGQQQQQQQGQSQSAAQASAAGVSLQRLLLLAQELMQCLDISAEASSSGAAGCDSPTAEDSAEQLVLSPGTVQQQQRTPGVRAAAAALPECCRGVLKLRIAVHVGALHAGVVGARRPRYRLLGPALQFVKQASAVAPPNTVVATGAAASQLLALGVSGLQPLSVAWPEPAAGLGDGNSSMQQLWIVTAAAAVEAAAAGSRSSSDKVHALLKAAASAVAAGAASKGCNGDGVPLVEQQEHLQQQQQQRQSSRISSESLQPLVGTPKKHQQQRPVQPQQQMPNQPLVSMPLQQLLVASTALSMPPLAWQQQQQQLMQQQLLQQQQLLAAAGFTRQVLAPTVANGLPFNCAPVPSFSTGWPAGPPMYGSLWGSGEPSANGHAVLAQPAAAAAPAAAGASSGSSTASGASTAAPARTTSGVSNNSGSSYEAKAGSQQQQQHWQLPGLFGGPVANGSTAAELNAALAALAGFQLGADETQQIMELHQELDLMQQQVAALTGGGLHWATPTVATAANGVSDNGGSNGLWQCSNGVTPGVDGAGLSPAAAAALLAQLQPAQQCQQQQQQRSSAERSAASSTGASGNSSSSRNSPQPAAEAAPAGPAAPAVSGAEASRNSGSSTGGGHGRGKAAAQQLGQLFRRRPRKKSDS